MLLLFIYLIKNIYKISFLFIHLFLGHYFFVFNVHCNTALIMTSIQLVEDRFLFYFALLPWRFVLNNTAEIKNVVSMM